MKEFPDTFFDGIYKVYRLEKAGKNHPSFFGGIINKYIYYPLANSHGAILKKLQAKDPVVECKGRRYKLHQFLTEEVGKPLLRKEEHNDRDGIVTESCESLDRGWLP